MKKQYWIYYRGRVPIIVKADSELTAVHKIMSCPLYDGYGIDTDDVMTIEKFAGLCRTKSKCKILKSLIEQKRLF